MFKRKLTALDYPGDAELVTITDEERFRQLIVWLEDQKIRHYKVDDREALRKIDSPNWTEAFKKFLIDIKSPYTVDHERAALTDWLLGYAVKLEYGDNASVLKEKATLKLEDALKTNAGKTGSQNPLDRLDFYDGSFRVLVEDLAKLLGVARHSDHLVTLEAICRLVQARLSNKAVNEVLQKSKTLEGTPVELEKHVLGFDTKDYVLNNAGRVLRLLHVHNLRDLQTKINEVLVDVQKLTADPKVDEQLGKVGSK